MIDWTKTLLILSLGIGVWFLMQGQKKEKEAAEKAPPEGGVNNTSQGVNIIKEDSINIAPAVGMVAGEVKEEDATQSQEEIESKPSPEEVLEDVSEEIPETPTVEEEKEVEEIEEEKTTEVEENNVPLTEEVTEQESEEENKEEIDKAREEKFKKLRGITSDGEIIEVSKKDN